MTTVIEAIVGVFLLGFAFLAGVLLGAFGRRREGDKKLKRWIKSHACYLCREKFNGPENRIERLMGEDDDDEDEDEVR